LLTNSNVIHSSPFARLPDDVPGRPHDFTSNMSPGGESTPNMIVYFCFSVTFWFTPWTSGNRGYEGTQRAKSTGVYWYGKVYC
ncbi:hypothetical protein RvY_19482, partial [Ramazzottius varieornatus]